MDGDDVFDSVTWESPAVTGYDTSPYEEVDPLPPVTTSHNGPGFKQSLDADGPGPYEPKWEGFLMPTVTDPVRELEGTKDAYVSYRVEATVRPCPC